MENVRSLCNPPTHADPRASQREDDCQKCRNKNDTKKHLEQLSVQLVEDLKSVNENLLKADNELEKGQKKADAIVKKLF